MIKTLFAAEYENAASRNRAEPVAIWKARKFIEEHSSGELSLTKVAKAVGMNANYLSESFRRVTGINFVEYVARARFATACGLLQKPRLRISEIAFAADFNRFRNSTVSSNDFRVIRRKHIARPRGHR